MRGCLLCRVQAVSIQGSNGLDRAASRFWVFLENSNGVLENGSGVLLASLYIPNMVSPREGNTNRAAM